jgi:hypothetical protein
MSEPERRAEWVKAHRFHEMAEALGCSTTDIMGCTGVEGGALVLYTTDTEDEARAWVHRALLERRPDGIYRVARQHLNMVTLRDFMARMDEEIGPTLRRELGPPESH